MRPRIAVLLLIMLAIAFIDYGLGPTAEYLNAYELVRALAAGGQQTGAFLLGQKRLGPLALPLACTLWVLEASAAQVLLTLLAQGPRRWRQGNRPK